MLTLVTDVASEEVIVELMATRIIVVGDQWVLLVERNPLDQRRQRFVGLLISGGHKLVDRLLMLYKLRLLVMIQLMRLMNR
jgi:hypothetical protein